jgi:hypothetical protein
MRLRMAAEGGQPDSQDLPRLQDPVLERTEEWEQGMICSSANPITCAPIPPNWSVFMGRKTVAKTRTRYMLSDIGRSENRNSDLFTHPEADRSIVSQPAIPPRLTLLDGNLNPIVYRSLSGRIMARLACAEAREVNPHLADDYRIAWLTVWNASQGHADPWRYSFWCYLGKTPEKIIPELVARLEKHAAMEATRKPVQSVPSPKTKKSRRIA